MRAGAAGMIPSVKRPAATMLILATCSVLAAGCGGSGTTTSTSSGEVSSSTQLTRASATAYAHAVNLRAADVPGMSAGSSEGELPQTPSSQRSNSAFTRCFGGVGTNARLVKIHSPEFSAGRAAQSQSVRSTVEVWPTAALAARNNAAYFSSRGRRCFLRYLEAARRQLKRRDPKLQLGPLRVATVTAPLPGTSDGRLRTINDARNGHVRIHIYHDIFTFISGPAEIELEAIGFSKPVPTATEERLLSLLLKRVEAARL
jgi:hypothetical protein